MPSRIVNPGTVEHYLWPDANHNTPCDGWYLQQSSALNVIEERMPPGTAEKRHFHTHARQFFYCLQGVFTIEIEDHDFTLKTGDGIEVSPGQRHQAKNLSGQDVRFLAISQPPSHGDRTDV